MGIKIKNPLKSASKAVSSALKKGANILKSPTRLAAAAFTAGLSETNGWGEKLSRSGIGRTIDIGAYIAAAAAAVAATGGMAAGVGGASAGLGSAGTAGTASAAAGGTAAAGGISGTTAAMGAMAATTAAQTYMSQRAAQQQAREQAAAQAEAQRQAEQAARESEIMRKQALLSSQMSLSQRQNQATAIANKLRNTNVKTLGGEEERLGG